MKRMFVLILFFIPAFSIPIILSAEDRDVYEKIFAESDYIVRLDIGSFVKQQNVPNAPDYYKSPGKPGLQGQIIPTADSPDGPENWSWGQLTGFVIEDEQQKKWILTAGHGFVNGEPRDVRKILVYFRSGKKRPVEAKLAGYNKRLDVAFVKFLNQDLVRDIPAVKLGSSAIVKEGQEVISIGFPAPFSREQILTTGKVALLCVGINRGFEYPEAIIHTCAINHGSSGSPLLNKDGEVIGINVAYVAPRPSNPPDWSELMQDKFSIAVPIDDIKKALPLLRKGELKYAPVSLRFDFSGLFHQIDLEMAGLELKLPREGFMVTYIQGLAEESGFQLGDIILSCEGKSVTDWRLADLYRLIYLEPNLTKVFHFEVDREGVKVEIDLPLSKQKK